jgi:23S rRNA (guanosine2251-2'-O)-methyltransferase
LQIVKLKIIKMKRCILVLDNLRSVENTASIFRTAEGFGVSKIIVVGTTPLPMDRFGRLRADFAKVSLGAEKSVKWSYEEDIGKPLLELKEEGHKIVALEQHPNSKRLRDFVALDKFVLVVGGEVEGVSKEALELADAIVEIPMMGMKESLNVSVATGVALFHFLSKNSN